MQNDLPPGSIQWLTERAEAWIETLKATEALIKHQEEE